MRIRADQSAVCAINRHLLMAGLFSETSSIYPLYEVLYVPYLLRSTFLSNLPTLVLGMASMKTTSSGSHHLATWGRRKSRISSLVICPSNSGLATTQARGRSDHLGSGMPTTQASSTLGW